MNNNINFTGIRNISYLMEKSSSGCTNHYLSAELTGKDWHKFRKAVSRSGFDLSDYQHPFQRNFINVSTASVGDCDAVLINNVLVEEIDESIPLFQFAARLTRRIAKKKYKDFVIKPDYIKSDLFSRSTLLGEQLEDGTLCHVPQNVIYGAKNINRNIQKIMERYLRI